MTSPFKPRLMTTGIGSLPFPEGGGAASFVLKADLSIPFWPQIPKRSFLEQMIPQYSEGMPCVRIESADNRIVFDPTDKYHDLERFYERFLSEDLGFFALSKEVARGFHTFERMAEGRVWPIVKGQVTGPVTFSTGIADANRSPLYSDPELRDAAVKMLVRKTQWQMERLKPFASRRVLMFIDEPVLAAYGSSAYLNISERDVCEMESEIFEAIAAVGGISGIHVCGNSDWGVVIRTGVQVLNFDAYQYGTTIALYPEEVHALFDRDGCIAWGIVPTTEAIRDETSDALVRRFETCLDALADKGFPQDLLRERALLTPSCGAGSLSLEDARRAFDLLREVQRKVIGEDGS